MKYVTKRLENILNVTGIVNLHFFEFSKAFATDDEEHPFYELVFVNSGRLNISSEDYVGELTKNQMIIHRAGTHHSLTCRDDNAPTVIIIGFESSSGLIDSFSYAPTELSPHEVRKLAEIVKEGRNVFKPPYNVPTYNMKKKKNQPLGSEQLLANLLEYFLIKLLREHGGDEQQEETDAPNIISEVVRYLDDNFTERITIDELAFLFKTTRATLCKEFRLATGKTVVEFINEKKLDRAKKRILSTTDTFTAIAEELNFDSIHYFTRFFKKKTGLTPKEYRRGFTLSDKQITER